MVKRVKKVKVSFEDLVDEYGKLKQQESEVKKKIEELNKQIKQHMDDKKLTQLIGTKYKVEYQYRSKSTVDEAKLLEIIKAMDMVDLIETKEVVNPQKLEKALVEKVVEEADIADAFSQTQTVAFTYKALNKEGK